MKSIACTINYGATTIDYELLRADRKSLEVAVHPDKRVVVKAPLSFGLEAIEAKVRNRARWIKKQIAYFSQFDPRTPPRRYVGGESHMYLGRKYRLKITLAQRDSVLLKDGYFYIECRKREPAYVKKLLNVWYRNKAAVRLPEMFDMCWEEFSEKDLAKPVLKVRKLKRCWGSLSAGGQLTLNLRLIQAPKECVEYVIIHELCHLAHHNHGVEFYKLLDRTMPDWVKRKHKLEISLA